MEEQRQQDGRVWVDAFKVGDLVAHPRYGEQRYTEPQLLEAIRNFRKLSAKGYTTDVLREHGTEDSYVYGTIHDLRITEDGYFQALVEFFSKRDRDAFNAGILRQFSPGFAHEWLDPHTGEKMSNVLIELSFTSRAYQRNLRPPQVTNPGVVLSDATPLHTTPSGSDSITPQIQGDVVEDTNMAPEEEPKEEMMDEEPKEEFSMETAFSALSAKLDALMGLLQPAQEEPATMSDEETELVRLSDENAKLREQVVRMDLKAQGVASDRVDELVKLSAKLDADEFAKVVEYSTTTLVQEEIGANGVAATGADESIADIIANAPVKYGDGGKFSLWAAREYPERYTEIMEAARN